MKWKDPVFDSHFLYTFSFRLYEVFEQVISMKADFASCRSITFTSTSCGYADWNTVNLWNALECFGKDVLHFHLSIVETTPRYLGVLWRNSSIRVTIISIFSYFVVKIHLKWTQSNVKEADVFELSTKFEWNQAISIFVYEIDAC